jgi:DNA-binding transcriptional LysR family regulator
LDEGMQLKLRNLETFRLFAQTESVTETARLMRISQPAVSQVLKDLEDQVGVPLFKRIGRGLHLTPEARLLLPEVERLTSQIANVRDCALSLRDGQGGSLVVGCIPTLAQSILPQAIAGLRSIKPNVRLHIKSYTATEISRQVRLESADIGTTFLPINDAGVRTEPLLRTAITCLVPKTSPLARERLITPQQLQNECVIAQGPETPPGFVLRDYLKQAGLDDWPTLEVNQSIISLSLAEQGIGVALSHPLVLSTMNSSKVTAVPFEPQIPLTLALVYPRHREASIHVGDFVRILKNTLSEISKDLTSRGLPCEML